SSLAFAFAMAFAAAAPAVAHHSFAAEFDITKPVTLVGKVTKLEWTNPHAYLYVDVADATTGAVTTWEIEMGSPDGLTRLGGPRNLLKPGDGGTGEGPPRRHSPNPPDPKSGAIAATH